MAAPRRRLSTAKWLSHYFLESDQGAKNRDALLEKFEQAYPNQNIDSNNDPINIMCLDGGGTRGKSLCGHESKYGNIVSKNY